MRAWQWVTMRKKKSHNHWMEAIENRMHTCALPPVKCQSGFEHSGPRRGLTEEVNKAERAWEWIHNINGDLQNDSKHRSDDIRLRGRISLNGQDGAFVCRWQRGEMSSRLSLSMVIFRRGHNVPGFSWWVIAIYFSHYSSDSFLSPSQNLLAHLCPPLPCTKH